MTNLNKALFIAVMLCSPCLVTAQGDTSSGSKLKRALIEEVVVTAQKRESNLQDTALAISAFTGESMEYKGINDISGLQSEIPNFHVGREQDGFRLALRGIGLQGTSSISDPGVAFYVDGFYIPRPAGGSSIFFDANRVEVLRGPQGTLYGRNATGGVVNVISNEPGSEFEGRAGVSFGARDLIEVRGMVNIPLNDTVATRFAAVHTQQDGYHKNTSTAPGTEDYYGSDGDTSFRGQLLFEDLNGFDVLLSANYSELDGTGVPYVFLERNIGGPPPTQALVATVGPEDPDPLVSNNDNPAFLDIESLITFIRIQKSFNKMDAFLQAGYFSQDTHTIQDFDGSEVPISVFEKQQDNEAYSVEFRLSSNDDNRLRWLLGAYYFSEETFIFRGVNLNGLARGNFISLPDFLLDEFGNSDTVAGFGSATYDITGTLRLIAGLRYTRDQKDGALINDSNFGLPTRTPLPNDMFDADESFNRLTWKGGLEWDVLESALAYMNISSGYKAGGFNATSNGQPYNEETVLAYEGGIKSNPFGGRAQINADVFYYEYDDMQLSTLTTIAGAPGQLVSNAAEATIYGVEFDTKFEITGSLLLSLAYSYINAEFDEYLNTDPRNPGAGQLDLSGNRLPFVPEHTFSAGLQYEWNLGGMGSVLAAAGTTWHDELFMREYNLRDIDEQGSNTKTDITVSYFPVNSGLSITAYATNLENNAELANVYISPGFIGTSATAQYTVPRSYGIRLDYSF